MNTRRLLRWLPAGAVASLALGLSACGGKPSTKSTGTTAGTETKIDIGMPLFVPAELPKAATPNMDGSRPEPIVIQQSTILFDERVTLGTELDGKLELVARELEPGKAYDPKDPAYAGRLVQHPRDPAWWYWRLVPGDMVREGEVVAVLDDSQAILQKTSMKSSFEAAKQSHEQSESSQKDYKSILDKVENIPSSSFMEVIQYKIKFTEARVNTARIFQELAKYNGEYLIAMDREQRHKIHSPFTGKIVRILHHRGEALKSGEPIIEIQNTSRFRVEGKLDVQDAEKLLPMTPVIVEPIRSVGPEPYKQQHRQEVTGIAVSNHKNRPMIVTSSNDGTAMVWDVTGPKKNEPTLLMHPFGVSVKAIACGGPATAQMVATGCSDGKIRVFDLSNANTISEKAAFEYEEGHAQGLNCLAFSHDGKYLASAAGREVIVWDTETRKKKYTLPMEHRDDVKHLRFTQQATLISVCRDKTVRVWNLGTDGASLLRLLDHRSGAVDVVGVSTDGTRVLFDQDATRVDLVKLSDGRTVGSLLNTGGGMRFAGMALFSADDKYVLTSTGDADTKGELQLWATPESGRGSERRRLVTQYRNPVTCAAFSPDPANPFVAVGTQTGVIHFFKLPDVNEVSTLKGRIVAVTRQDARMAEVRVEVDNPSGKTDELLSDRGSATIIIDRNAKPEAVPAPVPVGPMPPRKVSVLPPANGLIQAGLLLPKTEQPNK